MNLEKITKLTKKQKLMLLFTTSAAILAISSGLTQGIPAGLKDFGLSLALISLVYWGMSD